MPHAPCPMPHIPIFPLEWLTNVKEITTSGAIFARYWVTREQFR
ncbi:MULTISPECIES: hypothetical protein [Calothrix]|nr:MULTISPECIES: hypothetical protein [Calothrix]